MWTACFWPPAIRCHLLMTRQNWLFHTEANSGSREEVNCTGSHGATALRCGHCVPTVSGRRGQSRSGWELVGVTFSRVTLDGPSLTPEGWPWTSCLLLGASYLGVGQHGRPHPPRYPHQKLKANVYGGLWALQETPDSPTLFIVGSDLGKVK